MTANLAIFLTLFIAISAEARYSNALRLATALERTTSVTPGVPNPAIGPFVVVAKPGRIDNCRNLTDYSLYRIWSFQNRSSREGFC